ncbi:Activated RNA polymerase II transcriptional coactivator p15 [Trachymyrmex septentrionalis]|uniref:Activated RNA polymerase II transcriptional coactivator p15 n=1 Tax=Trachymyrmex septentrionalis TaxID=34720 RepID=A0A195F1F8_9HYME|nr:PREDICTED: activated RNA polymerase II transcriptional coactivator p15 [Trachymyrmex septentrionalis]XP_018349392.1 PREDICTED: activated RNA polymerase II transcriptional coactivator p15 [Trachymyrmex septentrionalis]XP_018349393.1 PREDICTED: activated RNA polymerase II transcriptional coactivator p15 [Trachymyrmex septentrionalis]KYN34410.1 Activated RNA polymerase II transcriptional coactivator p15 [Trachymyrmex septentrionalis]
MPKSKEYLSDSDDSSSEEEVKSKKQKREREDDKATKDEKKPAKKAKTDDDTVWDLGNNRQVNVRNFKGKYYVDIREMYYDKEGDLKPGKKGICLSMQQWRKFMNVVEEVDEVAKSKS